MGRTSIDECLAPFLAANGMSCTVLDGQDHANVEHWFEGRPHRGTTVFPAPAAPPTVPGGAR